MPRPRTSNRLDFVMSDTVAARFAELQDSVREIGHSRPTPRTLVSALIMNEERRGEELERDLLMPLRVAESDAE